MCGDLLAEVEKIDLTGLHPGISTCQVTAACDVDNPLLGPHGAVMVYSRQKGANDQQLELLEKNMAHAIDVIEETLRRNIRTIPGTGAAGGLGAGLIAFAGATLQSGVELVLEASGFRQKIQGARLILTGEGRIDFQTAFGKTISGVVKEAARQGVPVIAVAGSVQDAAENLYPSGVSSLFSICQGPMTLEQAMKDTPHLMAKTVERILRAMQAGGFGQA
jgi:glycerate kinase